MRSSMVTVTRAASSVQKSAGFQGWTSSVCVAGRIQMLAEVALAVEQREGDEGSSRSAAERSVSPASTPRPPE